MEIIISPTEAITCTAKNDDRTIWSCNVVDSNGSFKRSIGEINDWNVGDGVMSEVVDDTFNKYRIIGIDSGMRCWIEEKGRSRVLEIESSTF